MLHLFLVAQTVTQASWGVRKKDGMDVEPCYPLFSAELESAEALASSQQKFQSLNLADYKVMRQLLPVMLVCHPTCLGSMVSNPDRASDIISELEFSCLQRMKK